MLRRADNCFRREADRALRWSAGIAGLLLSIAAAAVWVASDTLRSIAAAVAHACVQFWGALPAMLHLGLGLSVVAGALCAVLWLRAASRQWWTTRAMLGRLRPAIIPPAASVATLLSKHGLDRDVRIIDDARPAAFTAGLLAPRIFLSAGLLALLDGDELEAVLVHERSHLRHRDPAYLLAGRAVAAACFFVPAVLDLVRRHQAAVELAADAEVAAVQGERLSLSSAIVKLLKSQAPDAAASAFTATANLRLAYLLNEEVHLPDISRRSRFQTATVVTLAALPAVVTFGIATAIQHVALFLRCPV